VLRILGLRMKQQFYYEDAEALVGLSWEPEEN
jgi:hypothetical protein